jgi:hypothetical protein
MSCSRLSKQNAVISVLISLSTQLSLCIFVLLIGHGVSMAGHLDGLRKTKLMTLVLSGSMVNQQTTTVKSNTARIQLPNPRGSLDPPLVPYSYI